MKTKGSKILCVLLALVMVAGMLPVGQVAYAAGEYDAGFVSWDEQANNYTVHSPIRVRNATIGNATEGYDSAMFDTRFNMKNTGTRSWSYDAHCYTFSNTDWFTYGWASQESSKLSGTVEPGEEMEGVYNVIPDPGLTAGTYTTKVTFRDTDGHIKCEEDIIFIVEENNNPIIITVNSPYPDKGSVSGGGKYKLGDTVTITATPKTGYAFDYWTGQYGSKISDAGATYTFTATESGTFNAWFKDAPPISIIVNSVEPNKGSVSGGGEYKPGDTVTITATPKTGYAFDCWTDQYGVKISNAGPSYTFTGSKSGTFNAWFKDAPPISIIVKSTYNDKGSVSGGGEYKPGDTVTITATPKTGYAFNYWTDQYGVKISNAGPTYTFIATESGRFDAWFTDDISSATYTVTFDANGGSGTMDAVTVTEGEKLTLPDCGFTAPKGKEFDKWDKGAPGEQIDVTADMTIRAIWKEKPVELDPVNPFVDVAEKAFYYDAVIL